VGGEVEELLSDEVRRVLLQFAPGVLQIFPVRFGTHDEALSPGPFPGFEYQLVEAVEYLLPPFGLCGGERGNVL
jgi:hypothetical protein